jgi:hypothetical protein
MGYYANTRLHHNKICQKLLRTCVLLMTWNPQDRRAMPLRGRLWTPAMTRAPGSEAAGAQQAPRHESGKLGAASQRAL